MNSRVIHISPLRMQEWIRQKQVKVLCGLEVSLHHSWPIDLDIIVDEHICDICQLITLTEGE